MELYDPGKAEQVWPRVRQTRGNAESTPYNPAPLMMTALEVSAACLKLSGQLGSKHAASMQKISRIFQGQAACLRGICMLVTGQPPQMRAPACPSVSPRLGLQKCYSQLLHLAREYDQRSTSGEYGGIFRTLSRQTWEQGRCLLEILGTVALP